MTTEAKIQADKIRNQKKAQIDKNREEAAKARHGAYYAKVEEQYNNGEINGLSAFGKLFWSAAEAKYDFAGKRDATAAKNVLNVKEIDRQYSAGEIGDATHDASKSYSLGSSVIGIAATPVTSAFDTAFEGVGDFIPGKAKDSAKETIGNIARSSQEKTKDWNQGFKTVAGATVGLILAASDFTPAGGAKSKTIKTLTKDIEKGSKNIVKELKGLGYNDKYINRFKNNLEEIFSNSKYKVTKDMSKDAVKAVNKLQQEKVASFLQSTTRNKYISNLDKQLLRDIQQQSVAKQIDTIRRAEFEYGLTKLRGAKVNAISEVNNKLINKEAIDKLTSKVDVSRRVTLDNKGVSDLSRINNLINSKGFDVKNLDGFKSEWVSKYTDILNKKKTKISNQIQSLEKELSRLKKGKDNTKRAELENKISALKKDTGIKDVESKLRIFDKVKTKDDIKNILRGERVSTIRKQNKDLFSKIEDLKEVLKTGDELQWKSALKKSRFLTTEEAITAIGKFDKMIDTGVIPKSSIIPRIKKDSINKYSLDTVVNNSRFGNFRTTSKWKMLFTDAGELRKNASPAITNFVKGRGFTDWKQYKQEFMQDMAPLLEMKKTHEAVLDAYEKIQKAKKIDPKDGSASKSHIINSKEIRERLQKAIGKNGDVDEVFKDFKIEGDKRLLDVEEMIRFEDGSLSYVVTKAEKDILYNQAAEKSKLWKIEHIKGGRMVRRLIEEARDFNANESVRQMKAGLIEDVYKPVDKANKSADFRTHDIFKGFQEIKDSEGKTLLKGLAGGFSDNFNTIRFNISAKEDKKLMDWMYAVTAGDKQVKKVEEVVGKVAQESKIVKRAREFKDVEAFINSPGKTYKGITQGLVYKADDIVDLTTKDGIDKYLKLLSEMNGDSAFNFTKRDLTKQLNDGNIAGVLSNKNETLAQKMHEAGVKGMKADGDIKFLGADKLRTESELRKIWEGVNKKTDTPEVKLESEKIFDTLDERTQLIARQFQKVIQGKQKDDIYASAKLAGLEMGDMGKTYIPLMRYEVVSGVFDTFLRVTGLKANLRAKSAPVKGAKESAIDSKIKKSRSKFFGEYKRAPLKDMKREHYGNSGTSSIVNYIKSSSKAIELNSELFTRKNIIENKFDNGIIDEAQRNRALDYIDALVNPKKPDTAIGELGEAIGQNIAVSVLSNQVVTPIKQTLAFIPSALVGKVNPLLRKENDAYLKKFGNKENNFARGGQSAGVQERTIDSVAHEVSGRFAKAVLGSLGAIDKKVAGSQGNSIGSQIVQKMNKNGLDGLFKDDKFMKSFVDDHIGLQIDLWNGSTKSFKKSRIHREPLWRTVFAFTNPVYTVTNNYTRHIASALDKTERTQVIAKVAAAVMTTAYFDMVISKTAMNWGSEEDMAKDITENMIGTIPVAGLGANILTRGSGSALGPTGQTLGKIIESFNEMTDDEPITREEVYNFLKITSTAFGVPTFVTKTYEGVKAYNEGGYRDNKGKLRIAAGDGFAEQYRYYTKGKFGGIDSSDYWAHKKDKKFNSPQNVLLNSSNKEDLINAINSMSNPGALKDEAPRSTNKMLEFYFNVSKPHPNLSQRQLGNIMYKEGVKEKRGSASNSQYEEYLVNRIMIENNNEMPEWYETFIERLKSRSSEKAKWNKHEMEYIWSGVREQSKEHKDLVNLLQVKMEKAVKKGDVYDIIKSSEYMTSEDWMAWVKTQPEDVQEDILKEVNN